MVRRHGILGSPKGWDCQRFHHRWLDPDTAGCPRYVQACAAKLYVSCRCSLIIYLGTITVKGGDNCFALAQQYHTTWDAIVAANQPAVNSGCTNLQVGQVIKIPGLGGPPTYTGKGIVSSLLRPNVKRLTKVENHCKCVQDCAGSHIVRTKASIP